LNCSLANPGQEAGSLYAAQPREPRSRAPHLFRSPPPSRFRQRLLGLFGAPRTICRDTCVPIASAPTCLDRRGESAIPRLPRVVRQTTRSATSPPADTRRWCFAPRRRAAITYRVEDRCVFGQRRPDRLPKAGQQAIAAVAWRCSNSYGWAPWVMGATRRGPSSSRPVSTPCNWATSDPVCRTLPAVRTRHAARCGRRRRGRSGCAARTYPATTVTSQRGDAQVNGARRRLAGQTETRSLPSRGRLPLRDFRRRDFPAWANRCRMSQQ